MKQDTTTVDKKTFLKNEDKEKRCMYCSELATGYNHTGQLSCGDALCGGEIDVYLKEEKK